MVLTHYRKMHPYISYYRVFKTCLTFLCDYFFTLMLPLLCFFNINIIKNCSIKMQAYIRGKNDFFEMKLFERLKIMSKITYFGITLYCIQYSFLYLALRIFVYGSFLNRHLTFIFYFYHKWLLSDIILEWNTVFMCFVQELE